MPYNVAQTMNTSQPALHSCAALLALFLAVQARGQVPASPLEIKSIAEVESRATEPKGAQGGRGGAKLVPADRVVPGDRVIYTLEVRNAGATALDAPDFQLIPSPSTCAMSPTRRWAPGPR